MNWQSLEQRIRDVSALQFGRIGVKENINGVDLDCVIKLDEGQWVIVEISKERKLDKVRIDVNRLILVRRHLYDKLNIMSKCFFVCLFNPTAAMIEAGAPHHIDVLSQLEFESQFFDFATYVAARSQIQFGSSVHPITGEPDTTDYVPVKYIFGPNKREFTIQEVSDLVRTQKIVVITGEYGSGKSRCIREAFLSLSKTDGSAYYFAIDLKTTWGLQSGEEVIRRHFDSVGLRQLADFAVRAYNNGNVNFLLDGFDEVGSQAWSDDPKTLQRIRFDSLRGVRDLITSTKGGVLIVGREHYFNSANEMITCLGANSGGVFQGRCKDEFTDEELESFLALISEEVIIVPEWLPRRPLMCQAIASLEQSELSLILNDINGDIAFWNAFVEIMCKREARIRQVLDADTIKSILIYLARLTRSKEADVGPISYSDIQHAFEAVLGTHPVDEASVLLQRLPGLGRTSLDTDDRQFIDTYILDGLRALDLMNAVEHFDSDLQNDVWRNPLSQLGQRVLADSIAKRDIAANALNFAHRVNEGNNKILVSDIVCSLLWIDQDFLDFNLLTVSGGEMVWLYLSIAEPRNLIIKETIIFNLVFPSNPIDGVQIVDCTVENAYGVSGERGVPSWVKGTSIETYESVATVSAIKNVDLSPQHRILVTILKKTFFQPGAGRQEAALLRGLGQLDRQGYTDKILSMLISENLLKKGKGRHGNLFVPNRKHSNRVGKILAELSLSEDPLWTQLSDD